MSDHTTSPALRRTPSAARTRRAHRARRAAATLAAVGWMWAGMWAAACAPATHTAGVPAAGAPAALPSFAAHYTTEGRELTADEQIRHALARLTFGARPGDYERVRAMGVDRWIDQQLFPERIPDGAAEAFVARFPDLARPGAALLALYPPPGQALVRQAAMRRLDAVAAGDTTRPAPLMLSAADSLRLGQLRRRSYQFVGELQAARVGRAVASERQLQEILTDFWENHFSVFAGKDRLRYYLPAYDTAVRAHAMGRFRDLLGAVAHSPAMLYYLDNWQSTADSAHQTLATRQGGARGRRPDDARGPGAPGLAALAAVPDAARSLDDLPPAARARVAALPEGQRAFVARYLAFGPAERARLRARLGKGPNVGRPRGLNENYARELMELHTLGVDGGYTQQDVINVARALTGWTVNARGTRGSSAGGADGGFVFRPEMHDAGEKLILGQHFPAGRGEAEGERVLDLIARRPSTARFIARKLCVRFVSDSPSTALVQKAADAFTRSDGDVRATLAVILHSPEFFSRAAYHAKVKTPFELVASAARALGAAPDTTPRTAQLVARLGQPLFGHQAPDGWPETGDAWVNTGSILNRINFGTAVAAGRVPGVRLAQWPAYATLRTADRPAQIDGVVAALLGGEASPDTRAVLARGENLLATQAAREVGDGAPTPEADMAADAPAAAMMASADRRAARRDAREPGAAAVAREAVKPGRAAPAFGGPAPHLDPFAQLVGLALGAPEFQRR